MFYAMEKSSVMLRC